MNGSTIINILIEKFQRLPGIGPRQAARFVYSIIDDDPRHAMELSKALSDLKNSIIRCKICGRATQKGNNNLCQPCLSPNNISAIFVVEKDQDADAIEKTGSSNYASHILGGLVLLGNKESIVHDRIKRLYRRVEQIISNEKSGKNVEIILAFSASPEGDSTAIYIEKILEPFIKTNKVKITRLGRGLSAGSELEYADPQTLKNAIENRK